MYTVDEDGSVSGDLKVIPSTTKLSLAGKKEKAENRKAKRQKKKTDRKRGGEPRRHCGWGFPFPLNACTFPARAGLTLLSRVLNWCCSKN